MTQQEYLKIVDDILKENKHKHIYRVSVQYHTYPSYSGIDLWPHYSGIMEEICKRVFLTREKLIEYIKSQYSDAIFSFKSSDQWVHVDEIEGDGRFVYFIFKHVLTI